MVVRVAEVTRRFVGVSPAVAVDAVPSTYGRVPGVTTDADVGDQCDV